MGETRDVEDVRRALEAARTLPWTSRGVEALLGIVLEALHLHQRTLQEGAPDPRLAVLLREIGDAHPGILVGLLQSMRGGFHLLPTEAPRGSAVHSRVLEAERELAAPSWGHIPTLLAAHSSPRDLDPGWLVPVLRSCATLGDHWLTILPYAVVARFDDCARSFESLRLDALPHLAGCELADLPDRPELSTALGLWDDDTSLELALLLAHEVHA